MILENYESKGVIHWYCHSHECISGLVHALQKAEEQVTSSDVRLFKDGSRKMC
jgi:hypothetical protein